MKNIIIGIDEAGRGPLAGPVVAAAVILPNNFDTSILNDSKKLSEKKRVFACKAIKKAALFGVGVVSHLTIDKINILNATLYAMKKAVIELFFKAPNWINKEYSLSLLLDNKALEGYIKENFTFTILVDGNKTPDLLPLPEFIKIEEVTAIVRGDSKVPEIMAASIVAKVKRDKIMEAFDTLYPQYNYAKNKGYPTAEHRKICHAIGTSPIQRVSFRY